MPLARPHTMLDVHCLSTIEPMACGVFWFLHIGKTGGGEVKRFLGQVAARKNASGASWTFVDLFSSPRGDPPLASPRMATGNSSARWRPAMCDPPLASPSMTAWNSSATWRPAHIELQSPRPRLLVHQHHCSPGLGAHLLPQLLRLRSELESRGCQLYLATVLREPAALAVSSARYNQMRSNTRGDMSAANNSVDEQIKYVELGFKILRRRSGEFSSSVPATPQLLEDAARTLSAFDLVGRTENLTSFIDDTARIIGVQPPRSFPHVHSTANLTHSYDFTKADMATLRARNALDVAFVNRITRERRCDGKRRY